jgi:hypothetical protein
MEVIILSFLLTGLCRNYSKCLIADRHAGLDPASSCITL